jgi:hypothetical protein
MTFPVDQTPESRFRRAGETASLPSAFPRWRSSLSCCSITPTGWSVPPEEGSENVAGNVRICSGESWRSDHGEGRNSNGSQQRQAPNSERKDDLEPGGEWFRGGVTAVGAWIADLPHSVCRWPFHDGPQRARGTMPPGDPLTRTSSTREMQARSLTTNSVRAAPNVTRHR